MTIRGKGWLLLGCFLLLGTTGAGDDPADAWSRLRPVRGESEHVSVEWDQTLLDIAHDRGLGFENVARLNPDLDPWIPAPGSIVRLPTLFVLPDAETEGIVVNLPEMRLYDYTESGTVRVLPVAIGDVEDPTPVAEFRIGTKREDPIWNVPRSIRSEKPDLPERVPPGPENPLGDRWMTLGNTSYGIHGTNVRWSIGRIATHGCVRLYETDMRSLYERVPTGTRVQIVYQPFKWGTNGRQLQLEAHPDVYGRDPDRLASALQLPRELGLLETLDLERTWRVVEEARGVPVFVGSLPRPIPPPPGPTSTRTS
jgi:L,D-transpeptidase ErfK/SrfK